MFHAPVHRINLTHQCDSFSIPEPTLAQPCCLTPAVYMDLKLYILWFWMGHKDLKSPLWYHTGELHCPLSMSLCSEYFFLLAFALRNVAIVDSISSTFLGMPLLMAVVHTSLSICGSSHISKQDVFEMCVTVVSSVLALILRFHPCAWPGVGIP